MEEKAPESQRDLGVKLSVPPESCVNSPSCIFSKLWFPDLQMKVSSGCLTVCFQVLNKGVSVDVPNIGCQ